MNLVETSAVATTEILTEYMPKWGLPITQSIASVLLTGVITDTLGFRTSNITPNAMRIAAQLMELGADLSELYNHALKNKTFEAMRLWGSGLGNLERNGPLVWTTLTLANKRAAGYPGRDDADLINILSSITGAVISLIFVEQSHGAIKVSWRSQQGVDISQIALQFGGGGHPAAAGAEIEGSLENVRNKVLEETNKLLEIHSPLHI
jgi:phosphoesterase RecJ-like protein